LAPVLAGTTICIRRWGYFEGTQEATDVAIEKRGACTTKLSDVCS